MDDNIRDVLIALVTVAGGFLTALAVAKITAGATKSLERTKWKRDLYTSFIHSAGEIRDAVHLIVAGTPSDEGWTANIDRGQRALIEITMIAPSMRGPAEAVWDAAGKLMAGVLKVDAATPTPAGAAIPLDGSRYANLDDACRLAIAAFVDRARRELGD